MTATDERPDEVRRRIAALETRVQAGAAEARTTLQRYIDDLRDDEEAANASVREEGPAERFEQLDASLERAEHVIAAELAPTKDQLTDGLQAELDRWDAHLDRMHIAAAEKSGIARERATAALQQRRASVSARLAAVAAAPDEEEAQPEDARPGRERRAEDRGRPVVAPLRRNA